MGILLPLVVIGGCPNEDIDSDPNDDPTQDTDGPSAVVASGYPTTGLEKLLKDRNFKSEDLRPIAPAKADAGQWGFESVSDSPVRIGPSAAGVALPGNMVLFTGGDEVGANSAGAHAYIYAAAADSWTTLPDMNARRNDHTMTRLDDGRVLIAGGFDENFQSLASAELYDPATMTFTPTPNMNHVRTDHTATLLEDGRVLIVGGDSDTGLAAEIYDPTANTFTSIADAAAQARVAARLTDGRVLLAGAFETLEAQVFDPATEQFTRTGDLNEAHGVGPTLTVLPDGRALLAGGDDLNRSPTATTELFDPTTNTFTPGPLMSDARERHSALLLPDGTVMLLGGLNDEGDFLATADVFDPTDDTITAMTSTMSAGRSEFVAVVLTP